MLVYVDPSRIAAAENRLFLTAAQDFFRSMILSQIYKVGGSKANKNP